ncbi:MAG: hypothetical protein KGL39_51915 [Patescibacteria group bacterium]|nr:hypothetical protein [Patescibacteria group bacterium]
MTTAKTFTHDGKTYRLNLGTDVPSDFHKMDELGKRFWIMKNTKPQGTPREKPNPLAGFGGAISLTTR